MDIATGFGYNFNREENVRRSSRIRTGAQENDILPRAKRRKEASRKKTIAIPRKNRPCASVNEMNLQCCTENTCLLNHGRQVIEMIRRDFDSKLYDEQNNFMSSLIDVSPRARRNRITYSIRDISGLRKVNVCKKAFLKILGIGKKRITVLIKKIQPFSGDVEKDQRPFSRNEKRLPLALKAEVLQHIRSYDRQQSHYARKQTRDRQFLASNLSIAEIWRQFLMKKEIEVLGDNLPMSYSSFWKIFRTFKLSFKKPYNDTCGKCDSLSVIIKYTKDEEERASALRLKNNHVTKADEHYDCLNFDLNILPKRKNMANEPVWASPPMWSMDSN